MPLDPPSCSFASDNTAGAHPLVLEALAAAAAGPAAPYGDDDTTARLQALVRDVLDAPVEVLACFGGTGANVVGLQAMLRPHEAVLCAAGAHVDVDECGAPERIVGTKLVVVDGPDGMIDPAAVPARLGGLGVVHHVQPRVLTVSQSTESGRVYPLDHLAELCAVAHRHGLLVHVDGARFANAAAALGEGSAAAMVAAGVDVLTFGGTKNGLVFGELVVIADPEVARVARFAQKQAGQLPSKTRFVSAQFEAMLTDGRWLAWAGHANAMAARLVAGLAPVGVEPVRPVEANAVFAVPPEPVTRRLLGWTPFSVWDPATGEVRWMTSWATTADDVDRFVAGVAAAMADPAG